MTREQVLAMEPMKLAEAVAVHVMGWEVISERDDLVRKQIASYRPGYGIIARYGDHYVARSGGLSRRWNPAEDISAAWEVEEAIPVEKRMFYVSNLIFIAGTHFDLIHASPADRCKSALLTLLDF